MQGWSYNPGVGCIAALLEMVVISGRVKIDGYPRGYWTLSAKQNLVMFIFMFDDYFYVG